MRVALLCVAVLLAALAAGVPDQGRRRKVKKILATSPLPDESGLEATAMTPVETGAVQADAESGGGEPGKDDNQKAPRG
jgi:hypothetical protein